MIVFTPDQLTLADLHQRVVLQVANHVRFVGAQIRLQLALIVHGTI